MWGALCGWGLPLLKATGSTPRSQRKLATRPAVSERPLGFPRVAFVWSDHFPSDGSWSCLWCGLLVSTHHAAAPSPGASGIRRPPWAMGMPLPHGRDTSPRSMVCCWVTLPLVSASGPLETLPCCVLCRATGASACGASSLRGVSRRLSAPQHLLVPVPVPDGSSGTCSPCRPASRAPGMVAPHLHQHATAVQALSLVCTPRPKAVVRYRSRDVCRPRPVPQEPAGCPPTPGDPRRPTPGPFQPPGAAEAVGQKH